MKILAVRHGVTPWNAQHRWQGATDIPLSDEGLNQALHGADRLRAMGWRGTSVFCSALSRSVVTAKTICSALCLRPPKVVPQLGERDLGEWEGLSVYDVELHYPGSIAAWRSGVIDGPPGGETDVDVAERFYDACKIIGNLRHGADPALVITHAGLLHAVDKIDGSGYSNYGPLAGRWFELASEASGPRVVPDGAVDLLGDEYGMTADGNHALEV